MIKIFNINGTVSVKKQVTEAQYEEFKTLVAGLAKVQWAVVSVEDSAYPEASESFPEISPTADFSAVQEFVNALQDSVEQLNVPPVVVTPEDVFAKYGITPAPNSKETGKAALASLNDQNFYDCSKELFYAMESMPYWYGWQQECDAQFDFRVNPSEYRALLQSKIFAWVDALPEDA